MPKIFPQSAAGVLICFYHTAKPIFKRTIPLAVCPAGPENTMENPKVCAGKCQLKNLDNGFAF